MGRYSKQGAVRERCLPRHTGRRALEIGRTEPPLPATTAAGVINTGACRRETRHTGAGEWNAAARTHMAHEA